MSPFYPSLTKSVIAAARGDGCRLERRRIEQERDGLGVERATTDESRPKECLLKNRIKEREEISFSTSTLLHDVLQTNTDLTLLGFLSLLYYIYYTNFPTYSKRNGIRLVMGNFS